MPYTNPLYALEPPPRDPSMDSGQKVLDRMNSILDIFHIPNRTREEFDSEQKRRRELAEDYIIGEVRKGNIPDFMRPSNWPEVSFETYIDGNKVRATVKVCPDFFAVGGNDNYKIIPFTAVSAQRIANEFNWSMPTPIVVDVIDAKARTQNGFFSYITGHQIFERMKQDGTVPGDQSWNAANPTHGKWMLSPEFTSTQNTIYQEMLHNSGNPTIRSGYMKTVVYDNGARPSHGDHLVIYRKGEDYNWTHPKSHVDYSLGIRFIAPSMELTIFKKDGSIDHYERKTIVEIMNDPKLHLLIAPETMDLTTMYRGPPSTSTRRQALTH